MYIWQRIEPLMFYFLGHLVPDGYYTISMAPVQVVSPSPVNNGSHTYNNNRIGQRHHATLWSFAQCYAHNSSGVAEDGYAVDMSGL